MNKGRITARVFLYAILVAAIAATFVAVTTLRTPAPPAQADEIDAFSTAIADATDTIIESRERALIDIENTAWPAFSASSTGPFSLDTSTGFGPVRTSATRQVESRICTDPVTLASGRIVSTPELDATLDEADRLYALSNSDITAALVPFFLGELEKQADINLRLLGYRKLVSTLGRDLIRYRGVNSLQFHAIKSDIYGERVSSLDSELGSMRDASHVRADEITAGIQEGYDVQLAGLVDEIARALTESEPDPAKYAAMMEILDEIKYTINGFSGFSVPNAPSVQPAEIPISGRVAWLSGERDINESISSVSGISGSE